MEQVIVNFEKKLGAIKPMHAVNNGPAYKFAADQRITNIDAFREAGIPYARNHDAAFYATYGGEHCVDITAIFPNFDADPYDPASYDFACTDNYLKIIEFAGVKTFYRLGQKIEHYVKKFGTIPPKDFQKWAVICEHIIRHYNYGWADGFQMGIEYWEIWNEPDLDADDSTNKRCWGGTKAQFFEFYHVAATHLKACFPELKIGGPALAHNLQWAEDFLKQLQAPLDFFSWHIYACEPEKVRERALRVRQLLDENGYETAESILNEWNYVRGWESDEWLYSLRAEKSLKGAAFIAAVMSTCQKLPLDLLMYYDARPCAMNGMFNTDWVCDKLKGYYPFYVFNVLYQLGTEVETAALGEKLYACAAKKNGEGAIMLTYYTDDDAAADTQVAVDISKFSETGAEASYYLLDEDHDLELVRTETFAAGQFQTFVQLPRWGTMLIKLKQR